MTAATYNDAKPRKSAAKPARARATRPKTTPVVAEEPIFSGVPAYSRIHERKGSRLPLIAGGIAVVATIALVAGTSRTARDAEPFTPTQTASAPAAMATTPVQPALVSSPDTQLIAPAPATVIRQQARAAPRPTPAAPSALDATEAGQNASATTPAPIIIPQAQVAPQAEAVPAPQPTAPEAAIPEVVAPEAAAPAPMSNTGPFGKQNLLSRGLVTGV